MLRLSFAAPIALAVAFLSLGAPSARAQQPPAPAVQPPPPPAAQSGPIPVRFAPESYTRLNTWSIFGEYAPDSSHIFLGVSEQRRLATGGLEYARRLLLRPRVELDYLIQLRPVIFERDPTFIGYRDLATGQIVESFPPVRVVQVTHSQFFLQPQNVEVTEAYASQWTYAGGANPIGFKLNFRPGHRFQPFLTSMCGFIWGTRQIPVDGTTAYNFDFEFGGGFETYLSATRSFRVGYSVHHMSNAYVGSINPGVDTALMQFTYSFGR